MSIKRKPLTPEEQSKSYAKYYNIDMTPPDRDIMQSIINGPIDPNLALKKENMNDLFHPGYLASEYGYCKFPDGTAYASSFVAMPGVTAHMIDWWFAWHSLYPLRYKIWNPEDHFDAQVSDADRERLTDSTIPLRERVWGVESLVKENIGIPAPLQLLARLAGKDMQSITIGFTKPEDLGFDMSRCEDPEGTTIVGSSGGGTTMIHFIRTVPGGVELRTRFWCEPEAKVPTIFVEKLTLHALKEYTHLANILPSLYAEEKDNW